MERSAPALSETPLTFIPEIILRGAMAFQSKMKFFCGHPVDRFHPPLAKLHQDLQRQNLVQMKTAATAMSAWISPFYIFFVEGDCDSDDECAGDLSCGDDNCPTSSYSIMDCCMDWTGDYGIEIIQEKNYQWNEIPIHVKSEGFICQYNL